MFRQPAGSGNGRAASSLGFPDCKRYETSHLHDTAALAVAAGFLNLQAQAPEARSPSSTPSRRSTLTRRCGRPGIEQRGIAEITDPEQPERHHERMPWCSALPEEQKRSRSARSPWNQPAYVEEVAAAAEPAVQAVDQALKAVAAEQGYTVVFDYEVAEQSGMVVYAQDGLDIPQLVIDRLPNRRLGAQPLRCAVISRWQNQQVLAAP